MPSSNCHYLTLNAQVIVIDLNCLELIINCRIDNHVYCAISMYYHRSGYTLLNRRVHSFIDDITGPIARVGSAEAVQPAEEANQIPPGGLIEWI